MVSPLVPETHTQTQKPAADCFSEEIKGFFFCHSSHTVFTAGRYPCSAHDSLGIQKHHTVANPQRTEVIWRTKMLTFMKYQVDTVENIKNTCAAKEAAH